MMELFGPFYVECVFSASYFLLSLFLEHGQRIDSNAVDACLICKRMEAQSLIHSTDPRPFVLHDALQRLFLQSILIFTQAFMLHIYLDKFQLMHCLQSLKAEARSKGSCTSSRGGTRA
jgi:hypothetical protein